MDFTRLFDEAGCIGSLHAVRLWDGTEVSHDADRPQVLASVVKVPIGLEFYAQADSGRVDPTERIALEPARRTPGPVGISQFEDIVTMSLRDLSYLMLTISDNAAAGAVMAAVGISAVNDRLSTHRMPRDGRRRESQGHVGWHGVRHGPSDLRRIRGSAKRGDGARRAGHGYRPRAHRPMSSARSPADIADNGEGCDAVARRRVGWHCRQSASVRDASPRHVPAGDSASRWGGPSRRDSRGQERWTLSTCVQ